jgi:hypothetical protein
MGEGFVSRVMGTCLKVLKLLLVLLGTWTLLPIEWFIPLGLIPVVEGKLSFYLRLRLKGEGIFSSRFWLISWILVKVSKKRLD